MGLVSEAAQIMCAAPAPMPAPIRATPAKYAPIRISAPIDPPTERRDHHPSRLIGAHDGAGEQRTEDESVNPQNDPEDAVTGEARKQPPSSSTIAAGVWNDAGNIAADYMMAACPPSARATASGRRRGSVGGVRGAVRVAVVAGWAAHDLGRAPPDRMGPPGRNRAGRPALLLRAPRHGRCASSRRTACASPTRSVACSPAMRSGTSRRSGRSSASLRRRRSCAASVPLAPALTALAIENVLYTLSAAAMIAAGMIALLFRAELPAQLRGVSESGTCRACWLFSRSPCGCCGAGLRS